MKTLLFLLNLLFLFSCSSNFKPEAFSVKTLTLSKKYSSATSVLDWVTSSGSACDADSATSYSSCSHGGHLLTTSFSTQANCSELTISDSLGVFSWSCTDGSGQVTIESTGFASGKGFADLIESSSWKENQLIVQEDDTTVAQSASAAFYDDTITAYTSGNISTAGLYVVSSDMSASQFDISADKVGFIVLNGATLSYDSGTNVTAYGTVNNLIAFESVDYGYLEGSFYLKNDTSSAETVLGVMFGATRFSRVHNVSAQDGHDIQVIFVANGGTSKFNRATGTFTSTDSCSSGVQALGCGSLSILDSDQNYFTTTITASNGYDALQLFLGDNNTIESDITCTTMSNRCLNFVAAQNNSFTGTIVTTSVQDSIGFTGNVAPLAAGVSSTGNTVAGSLTVNNGTNSGVINKSSSSSNTISMDITVNTVTGVGIDIKDSDSNTYSGSISISNAQTSVMIYDGADSNTVSNVVSISPTNYDLELKSDGGSAVNNNTVTFSTISAQGCDGDGLNANGNSTPQC